MTRTAVTSRSFSRHPILRAELEEIYSDVTFNDEGLALEGDSLVRFLRGHNQAITALEHFDRAVFAALPELRLISKYGVGLDMLDLEAMAEKNISLGWSGGVNKRSVSELVISNAIALLRHIPITNKEVLSGTWRQHMGNQLSGKTIGIIGCGHVGKDLAILLGAFGCHIIAYDIIKYSEFYKAHNIDSVSLEDLLKRADIVTIHTPLDSSTANILNADRLALMQSHALLINAARGGLVDEVALKQMLTDGSLAGAALDVFATEPPEDPALINLPNVITTPHIGGSSEEAILAMGRAAIQGLKNHRVPDESWPA